MTATVASTRPSSPDPRRLARDLLGEGGRVMVIGAPGTGKSTLVAAIADEVLELGHSCAAVCADPGQPAFGPPGAVSLALRRGGAWQVETLAGLATLDVARFRLPVSLAVQRLCEDVVAAVLLVDAPGVFRGMAAAELLPALVRSARIDHVLLLARTGEGDDILADLRAAGARVHCLSSLHGAVRSSPNQRIRRRSELWERWLEGAVETVLTVEGLAVSGAPPPPTAVDAWQGRQVVVEDDHARTLCLGEIRGFDGVRLTVIGASFDPGAAWALVVRDAWRDPGGQLRTAPQRPADRPKPARFVDQPIALPPPATHAALWRGTLVGGLFGDPLVHLREANAGRSILLDLGEHPELPVRLAHRVTQVFLSHAHMDHMAGFPWLLRRRVGITETCHVYGPRGTAERVAAFVDGFVWDRIGTEGPRFEITELDHDRLRRSELRVGERELRSIGEGEARGGVIHSEDGLEVRAVVVDHGTPVLAYAIVEGPQLSVRTDRLQAMQLDAGPWLSELKRCLAANRGEAPIILPDGSSRPAATLAEELITERPGQALAYATDVSDTAANRDALIGLASHAQLFLCEAAFLSEHCDRARETGHLTARACAEIATAARVDRLLPFHLSSRYQDCPEQVFAEVAASCDRLWVPPSLRQRMEI